MSIKKLLIGLLFFLPMVASATTLFPTGGGTGSTTLYGILIGNGTSPLNTLTIGSNLTLTGTTLSASGGGGTFPFTAQSYGNSTSTTIGFLQGLFSVGSTTISGLTSGVVGNNDGKLYGFASSSLFGYTPLNPSRAVNTSAPLTGGGALTGDLTIACASCSTFAYPFTSTTNYNVVTSATSTPIWARLALFASSTSAFDQINVGSTTVGTMSTSTFYGNVEIKGNLRDDSITSALLLDDSVGSVMAYTGTSCTNAILALSATGAATCGGSAFPFTYATTYNTLSAGTSTPLWLQGSPYSLFASSTSIIDYATSTAHTINGTLWLKSITDKALSTDVNGKFYGVATGTISAGSGITLDNATRQALGGSLAVTCATGSNTVFGCLTAANFLVFNNKVGTSTHETDGDLAYWTTTNGTPALLGDVATGTVSAGSTAITVTAGRSVIGGALAIDCAAAGASQNGCLSSANFTIFNNKIDWGAATSTAANQSVYTNALGKLISIATSTATISTGLSYSGTWGQFVGGTSGNLTVSGLTGTQFANVNANTVFGNATGASAAPTFFATSSLFTGATGQYGFFSGTGTLIGTSTLFLNSTGLLGVNASTTPWGQLSIELNTGNPAFVVANQGSTTPTFLIGGVNQDGNAGFGTSTPFAKVSFGSGNGSSTVAVLATEHQMATTTSITINAADGNHQLARIGASATTITLTGFTDGSSMTLNVCNPGSTAGAITWASTPAGILEWPSDTIPAQTTTAKKCDLYSFLGTMGTSTLKIFAAQTAAF